MAAPAGFGWRWESWVNFADREIRISGDTSDFFSSLQTPGLALTATGGD
jgi:hypothetical protein